MGADAALALVSAGRALQTLRLGEWAVPVGELRSGGESVRSAVDPTSFCVWPDELYCEHSSEGSIWLHCGRTCPPKHVDCNIVTFTQLYARKGRV